MIERDGETFFVRDIIEDLKSNISYDEAIMSLYRSIKETEEINKKYEELLKVNNDLFKRIDKAIEYIEKNWIEYSDFQYVDNDDELNIDCESIKELLDILKGSDKDDK